jgi:FkbM family methyltransferase
LNSFPWQPLDDFLSVDRHEIHFGTAKKQRDRLAIRTAPGAWYYAVSFPCDYSVVPAGTSCVLVRVNILVNAGRVGIGTLQADEKTFLAEQEFSPKDGPCVAELTIAVNARCERIMLRNASTDNTSSSVAVDYILTFSTDSPTIIRSTRNPRRGSLSDQKMFAAATVRTIVDVGANVGDTVEQYRETFPGASVYALEPAPDTFKLLAERFTKDSHVKSFQLALADKAGTSLLHLFEHHATHSLLPFAPTADRFSESGVHEEGTVQISTRRLDAFCKEQGIKRIDILKIDVQGSEIKVLEGGRDLFETKRIGMIFIEANFVPLYVGQAYFYEVMAFLKDFGFQLFDLYNVRHDDRGQIKWCDALFIRDD